jgi:hypothetical protein
LIKATVDTREFNAKLKELGGNVARAAVNSALTRAARSTAAEANRALRQTINVKTDKLKQLVTSEPSRSSSIGGAESKVRIAAKGAPLSDFKGTRSTKRGLSVQVLVGKARTVLRSAFSYPGKRGAFSAERVRKGGKRVPRGPVKVLYGPAAAQVAARPELLERLRVHAITRITAELKREVERRLAGFGRRS